MARLTSVCMVMLALLGAISAKSWTVQNDVPTGFNLYRMASGPTAIVAVGDACVMLRSLDQGGKWSQVPSGLSFTNSSFEALNWPGISFRDLAYDPNAGQFTALALSFANGYSTTAYTLVHSADSSASSFAPVPGFAYPGMQQVPVYGLGRWVSIDFTFSTATPAALVSTDLSAGFTSQPILLNCNCDIASAPAWSASLNAFILLLDREIQTSVDGVNWKTLYQNKYTPLPYLKNDALGYQPPRPVFADPTWLYFTNNSGVIYQVLVSFRSRTPVTTLLPLTVDFDAIAWVRYSSRSFERVVVTQQATILQYSSDAYTWYNYSAALPRYTTDVIGDTYFPALASGFDGGLYRTYVTQWLPLGVTGLLGNFLFARWLDGPKAGFYASGSGYLESAAPLAYSPDGVKWAVYNPVAAASAAAQDIQYLASVGLYVLVYPDAHAVYFSADGATYNNYTLPKTQGSHPQPGPVCGPNAPALVVPSSIDSESTALTLISTDGGRTFQLIATNQPASPLEACAYGNGVYVGIDSAHATVYTSATGAAWTKTVSLPGLYYYKNVKFVGANFVAVGDYGYVAFSNNGAIWTESTVPNGEAINGVTYANGQYLAVGEGGSVYSSADLMHWAKVSVPVHTSLSDGAYSPALNATVLVGSGGTVLMQICTNLYK